MVSHCVESVFRSRYASAPIFSQTREKRKSRSLPVVSLLGYTNAGKSELHSRLTAASAASIVSTAEDKLFATLDTTAKVGVLPSGTRAIFIDTVGFISDLPPELVQVRL